MIKAGNIRKGMYILFKNAPYQVTKTDFMSPGKGSALMRVKLKSVLSSGTTDFTFKSQESVEEVEVSSKQMQYLYQDASELIFMDGSSFEQMNVPLDLVGDQYKLLKESQQVYVLLYDEKPIGVRLPDKITLTVAHAEDADGGNTVGQARKMVELETGFEILAPLFVKTGDALIIDTATMSYLSRA
ncbi:MAG: elongation factor P [Candidatus Pacebacteria bacterium RIFCSPHIGHO2_01_FULL_46_16]|nr:MAG: elongation factor P [Candidatus Pacebacteria bacterium RIFCSPHIGHO2_01_FULL_46_16]OGJ21183.1 MAG: elongation factor P [Candidatus Pacebacteria bacterium RIFCSPHIGHO2_02_FULL_46_9]OGJ38993.1 MAG: elongation factor P [Candidatus Pacebacteria bacterium RIFCSPLOWO2_01_FULL_47_12]